MADAAYVKVRADHRVRSGALLVAIGHAPQGRREVIGVSLAESETGRAWADFLRSLVSRGLSGVRMVTSDANEGLVAAAGEVPPGAAWERCQAHFSRNVCEAAPKGMRAGLRGELVEMLGCRTAPEARRRRDETLADCRDAVPRAARVLEEGFEDAMTAMVLPGEMRLRMRTSNYLERLNREIKGRTSAVGVFPSEASAIRLVGSVLIEENDRWPTQRKGYYGSDYVELL
jgi:putative transposase